MGKVVEERKGSGWSSLLGTLDSSHYEWLFNLRSKISYRMEADSVEETARASTVRFMEARMFENICMMKKICLSVRMNLERLGCGGESRSWPCHTQKTTAHQPVPWKKKE
jgi:hypothetical protein